MRAKDEVRLRTLRSLSTMMTNEVVAKKRKPDEKLTDDEALAVLKRAASQRKDSIAQFTAAGRSELAEPEQAELSVIESYLPAQMSREEVAAIVERLLDGQTLDKASAGKFMGSVMKEVAGRADGALVKEIIDAHVA